MAGCTWIDKVNEMIQIEELQKLGTEARLDIVQMIYEAKAGHAGGSMSVIDILTVLYYAVMNVDPARPDWDNRDRLVLSKGHAAPALYVTLMNKGYFPRDAIHTLRTFKSLLQGHPDMTKTPGVDYTTGSLGNGLGIGNGFAMAARLRGLDYHTYVILGDGEIQEGTIWESAMTAAAKCLTNLTVIIDNNGLQVEGRTSEIKPFGDYRMKWESFGFETVEIDGHDYEQILNALQRSKISHRRPLVIIANTIKGKGVSFMEDQLNWHKGDFTEDTYAQAVDELKRELRKYE